MKLIPVIISIILASSALGYGIQASAQVGSGMAGSGGGTPCSASFPCAKICGDHPCAPGEVYTPGMQNTNGTKPASGTNNTGSAAAIQVNITTNVTATKNAKNTVMSNSTMTNMTAAKTTNGTMTNASNTMTTTYMHANSTMSSSLPSPKAQIVAGAQPQNVKCAPGLYLVLNNSDSRPACVTQNTMSALEARGWGYAAP